MRYLALPMLWPSDSHSSMQALLVLGATTLVVLLMGFTLAQAWQRPCSLFLSPVGPAFAFRPVGSAGLQLALAVPQPRYPRELPQGLAAHAVQGSWDPARFPAVPLPAPAPKLEGVPSAQADWDPEWELDASLAELDPPGSARAGPSAPLNQAKPWARPKASSQAPSAWDPPAPSVGPAVTRALPFSPQGDQGGKGADWLRTCALLERPGLNAQTMARVLDDSRCDLLDCRRLIRELGLNRKHGAVKAVLAYLQRAGLQPDKAYLTDLIQSFSHRKDWHMALTLFKAMQELGIEPDSQAYRMLISALDGNNQCKRAVKSFDTMDDAAGIRPEIYGAVIGVCIRGGYLDEAIRLYEDMLHLGPTPNVILFNMLINACGKKGMWKRALQVLEEMQKCGVRPDIITYSALIHAVGRAGEWRKALEVFEAMRAAGLTPNAHTYSSLISAFRRAGQFERAPELHAQMKASGLEPTVVTYSALISVWQRTGQWDKALQTFDSMIKDGIAPDMIAYTALLSAQQKEGYSVKAEQLLQERGAVPSKVQKHLEEEYRRMEASRQKDKGTEADQPLTDDELQSASIDPKLQALIDDRDNESKSQRAEKLWIAMRAAGVQPSVVTYNTMISVYHRTGEWQKARAMYKHMVQKGLEPDQTTFNSLICAFGRGGQFSHAIHTFHEMQQAGFTPNVVTFSALINVCDKTENWEAALKVLERMMELGLRPNVITYTTLITSSGRAGQSQYAERVFNDMKLAGVKPNVVTYSAMISICGKQRQWKRALELLQEMPDNNVAPNVYVYSAAIIACTRGGQWEEALHVWEQMQASGVPANSVTYYGVTAACHMGEQYRMILNLADRMRAEGVVPDAMTANRIRNAYNYQGGI
uniref:Pentatricopeptide repeat-containing protein-mitochondrial domain-containing protein n=1 Tax=Eutreptiella gymnastica TaxID=73025 RepID=A0A7S1IQ40_9EUGL|mmetsp:Transcript_35040/g.62625  ORF Transcript_35040/g.62625 Transcript_35040/m.62625 type:complete len:873 (+) Transcript_35040:104-2722(+)